jgi:hypothetical protein
MSPSISSWTAQPNSQNPGKPRFRTSAPWIWHIIYILYSLEVGILLLFLPWLAIWENNYLLYLYPEIRPFVANSFLKGAVLGLGIVNILIGIQEIAQFRKNARTYFPH